MVCMMVILRKQWVERERLIFPLVQVPIAMIQDRDEARSSILKPFFVNPLMWLGFLIPTIVQSINALHHYYWFFPSIRLDTSIPLFRKTIAVPIRLSFQMLGFSYFINRDIAFGLCFFYLLNTVEQGIFNILGLQKVEPVLGVYSQYTGSIVVHQAMGALIVLVLFGLWVARSHLKQVFKKAFTRAPEVDDSGEILSYRGAVFGMMGGLVFMGLWLWQSGLPGWITPIYLFFVFVLFIGITRVVAEGGVAFIFAPMIASDVVASGFGTQALGPSGIAAFSFTYIWASDILTFVMASTANGLKLVEETIRGHRRLIFWAVLIAIAVTLLSSIWMILDLAYTYGGVNTHRFFFIGAARYPFDNAAHRMDSPVGPNWAGWIYTAIGGLIMALLMIARQHLLWWPFHPLGFPISPVFGTVFFSVFLAWLFKSVVLKYGGPKLYTKTRPFFLGLILGQFISAGLWMVIDYFTGMTDNPVMNF